MAGLVRKAYRRLVQGLPDEPPTRKDIDLPLEAGRRRDRRLPAEKPNTMKSLGDAWRGYKKVRELSGGRSPSKR